ncbi:AMP-binding protein [Polynucleobacter paneuropaeus]|nr:AMP-binding protein [Polynucleobacter paneuropaeus]
MTNVLIDHLQFRARYQGDDLALVSPDIHLTYNQLFSLVKRVAYKLNVLGIQSGQSVCTYIPNRFLDWIITLALIHEATVSSALPSVNLNAIKNFDWLITTKPQFSESTAKTIFIDAQWLKDCDSLPTTRVQSQYANLDSPVRMMFTSGSTGESKSLLLSLRKLLDRSSRSIFLPEYRRSLTLMGLSTGPGLYAGVIGLISGLTFFCSTDAKSAIHLIQLHSIECLYGAPRQIKDLLDLLLASHKKITTIKEVRYAGSAASEQLIELIESNLSNNILNLYGSTEAGFISMLRHLKKYPLQAIGYAVPEVTVEVVSSEGIRLNSFQEGLIRLRTPHMVSQYENNPVASRHFFKDAWFYPGDIGFIQEDGLIVLSSRSTDVINLGGSKLNLVLVDQFLQSDERIQDGASFVFVDQSGLNQICVAVVVESDFDKSSLRRLLIQEFGSKMNGVLILLTRDIPRHPENKKVLRHILVNMLKSF